MAETEVSKEVSKMVAIEEKCGLDMSSYQDLPKPNINGTNHHNQANDLDNSYVFVTGADGLPDSALDGKGVVAGVPSVPPQPEESQKKKLGEVCEEAQHLSVGENGKVEQSNGDTSPVNYSICEHENSQENGKGVQVFVADSGEVNTCKIDSSPKAEVKQVEDSGGIIESLAEAEGFQASVADSQELHTGITESVAEANVEQVDDANGKSKSMPEAEVEKAVDQNGEFEGVTDGEQENFDGVTIAESPPCAVENQDSQVGALGLVAEIGENRESDNIFSNISSSNSTNDGENLINTSVTEALEQKISQDVVVDEDGHALQIVCVEAEDETNPTREVAEAAEHEVSEAAEHEDGHALQNVCVEAEDETNPTREVAEAAELEVSEAAEHEDGHALQNVCVEAEDETNPTREVAEAAEHEVSTSTSQGLDLESFSVVNMDKIPEEEAAPEEEAKTVLSSDVLENQQGDSGASNLVQDMAGETDESKPVVSSIDSQVQATRDLVLEENNEDLFVSGVENGVQYHEESHEQPVVSSTDSQVLTTSDLALEEKNEKTCVSEVEDGVQYHEESHEQPVISSTDSQVQTTGDLVLEEKKENTSVSEVEGGAQYHEESQEQPVGSSPESHVLTTRDLVLEEKNENASVSEVEDGVQYHEESQEQPVVSSTDFHVQTTRDLISEEKEEDSSVSEVESSAQFPEETQEQPDGCGASHDITPTETSTEASVQTQSYPAPNGHAPQSEIEVSDVEEIRKVSSPSVVGPESQTIAHVVLGHDSAIVSTLDEASSESDCVLDMVVPEKEISFEGGEADSETEVSNGKSEIEDSSPEKLDVKLEPEGHVPDFSAITSGEKIDDVAVSCRTEISDSCSANLEGAVNLELEEDGVEDVGAQLEGDAGHSKENLLVQEKENTEDSQNEESSVSSAGVSTTNTTDGEDKSIKVYTKPFNYLIRTPRFDDENLREQIRLAKRQVDEKTKLRDAIQLQIQEKRASSQIHGIDYEYAKNESRSARKLVRSKRTEIDSLQSVINKAKNALSIEDIDNQIHNMEHMIQHETLPLKEEKQFIREIKQLKQLREQLSSNMGSQDEIKQALQQRGEVEERLKILRKELDILKSSVLKAEATAAEAGKKYDDENRKVKELQAQFRAADDVRQEAYAQWQNLRKELSNKSKYFFKYKDDAAVASNYAFSRDTEAIYRLCTNQAESFMELWNTNPEFRRDYIKFNLRSTVWRFGTLDCRTLGPDEEPHAVPSYAYERGYKKASTPAKVDPTPQIPSVELNQKTPQIPSENVTLDSKSTKKVTEPKNQKVPNVPAITVQVNGLDTHTGSHLTDEVFEEPVKSRDEIESIRKAEEKRREEAEAKLKEQRRLEALAKANEARERKKRQAEKMQQRAELKTQKEAEQREKEREKRLRKKERKKAAGTDTNDASNSCETAASSESAAENSKDIEVKERGPATGKKAQKPWLAAKQSKAKSIPPPLRNRNKKKLQQWMWVGVTSFIILILFWMGNIGVFSNVALKRRAPFH